MDNLYGITKVSDNKEEQYIYTIGREGHIPVVLLALQASRYKNAVERYLSIYGYTRQAKESIKDLYIANPNLDKDIEHIAEVFNERDEVSQNRIKEDWKKNGMPEFKGYRPAPEDMGKYLMEYPRDTVLDFHVYTSQLAVYTAMSTPNYEANGEGVPQACSMSYIAFHQREEFIAAHKSVQVAFQYVVNEIVRIMKLRNIEVNENDMTVKMPSYKAISFTKQMYPGF